MRSILRAETHVNIVKYLLANDENEQESFCLVQFEMQNYK